MSCVLRSFTILCLGVVISATVGTRLSGQEDLVTLEERAMRSAVQQVAPCVVRIEPVGGVEQYQGKLLGLGPTTGVIVSEDGYILSSSFRFVGKPTSILVTLPSGRRTSASIVARDDSRMLVLLKAATDEILPVPKILARSQFQVGQWTLAVGRTFAGPLPNYSVGILSAKNRIWGKAVQTDAKISPSNYGGPLIDIRGNVIGILVPLSPQQQGEMAGAEWYDSGIGFAVPLADVLPRLEMLKRGIDLKPGILGVSLKTTDLYGLPATIAACPAKSPARAAGLKVGDTIVEVNEAPIGNLAQLRHALGPLVAGDSVRVVVERGDKKQRFEATIELVGELEPYVRPELGILPMREPNLGGDRAGVEIRFVIPDGPAATAGLRPGDRITGLNDLETADSEALRAAVIGFDPESEVTVTYLRDGQPGTVALRLARQAAFVPDELPPSYAEPEAAAGDRPPVGVVDIQIPEVANKCVAYVPQAYNPAIAYGLVVWLHAPGDFDKDALVKLWRPLCDQHDLILLAPQPADQRRWTPLEIEFIRKSMDNVVNQYVVDPSRVVVHGYLAGGAMAYYVAFGNREICRAVAPVAASLPERMSVPETDPVQPMAIFSCWSTESEAAERIQAGEQKLQQKAFPVVVTKISGPERYLDLEELTRLVRWIDALDRI